VLPALVKEFLGFTSITIVTLRNYVYIKISQVAFEDVNGMPSRSESSFY
jgi:hypothetical protein